MQKSTRVKFKWYGHNLICSCHVFVKKVVTRDHDPVFIFFDPHLHTQFLPSRPLVNFFK